MNHKENPLGTAPVGRLLLQYAIPSIISTLIASLYNMVDQMFIGQRIGFLGNAATTVAYPLTFLCGALTLLFSNGSAVNFNVCNGRGQKEEALDFAGAGLTLLTAEGLFTTALVLLFTPQIANLFGATRDVYPYALTYIRLVALGFPFLAALKLPSNIYNMMPYIVCLIVLAFTSKTSHAPKAEGIPYDKGTR